MTWYESEDEPEPIDEKNVESKLPAIICFAAAIACSALTAFALLYRHH